MHLLEFWCIKLEIPSPGKLDSAGYAVTFLLYNIFFFLVLTGGRRFVSPVVLLAHHVQIVEAVSLLQLLERSCSSTSGQEWSPPHPL